MTDPNPPPARAAGPRPRGRGEELGRRREAFCRHYVACGVGAEAARLAGYSPRTAGNRAYCLLARDDVRARIDEIRAALAWQECEGRDAIVAKLENVYQRALGMGCPAAAVRAIMAQARVTGTVAIERRLPILPPKPRRASREAFGPRPGSPEDDFALARESDPFGISDGGISEGDDV